MNITLVIETEEDLSEHELDELKNAVNCWKGVKKVDSFRNAGLSNWICPNEECGYINDGNNHECYICETRRP